MYHCLRLVKARLKCEPAAFDRKARECYLVGGKVHGDHIRRRGADMTDEDTDTIRDVCGV